MFPDDPPWLLPGENITKQETKGGLTLCAELLILSDATPSLLEVTWDKQQTGVQIP